MKIENIEIDIIDIDLTRPYTIAYKTTSSIKTLVVKIILSDGTRFRGIKCLKICSWIRYYGFI